MSGWETPGSAAGDTEGNGGFEVAEGGSLEPADLVAVVGVVASGPSGLISAIPQAGSFCQAATRTGTGTLTGDVAAGGFAAVAEGEDAADLGEG
ncbi:hypothetical protein ACWD6R_37705 [Streptomyces sp. NPDC005151]